MVKNSRKKKQDADLDLEINDVEPSESDDEYDDNEKLMLIQAAKRRSKQKDDDDESEEEVLGVHESDDDDDEDQDMDGTEPVGDEMDSDIEGKNEDNDLPDSKAWGTRKKSYYNTDYVDQDYGGFSKAEEEEAALLEEQEARAIQTRLIAELDDADISLGIIPAKSSEKKKSTSLGDDDFSEVIKTDVSKLSKREKLALLEKESPEFLGLLADFKERMAYAKDHLEPILNLVKSGKIPDCEAVKFISTKYHLILNYCTNIAFYLLLKSKRLRVTNHPVVKRLVQFRKLLEEMDPIDEEIIQPQVEEILKLKEKGKQLQVLELTEPSLPVLTGNRAERRRKLQQMKEEEENRVSKKAKVETFEDIQLHENEEESVEEEEEEDEGDTEKRGITYEIAKNKGLTPKRKKENRNPRVKHRNKFRKATVRRKGQVRGVYKEIKRYDGEPFGIKASVSKSVKLK